MTHPLHGEGSDCVLCQGFSLQQCYLNVTIQFSVIGPVLTALHLDKIQKDFITIWIKRVECFKLQ